MHQRVALNRLVSATGLLGATWLVPAIAAWLERGSLGWRDCAIASVGPVLILGRATAVWWGSRELRLISIPTPVRASIAGNGLFISFFMLEFSDGFVRSGRGVFYRTSALFLPALVLFYGQLTARRWAWWVARITTAIFTFWFVGFLMVIPIAHLRGNCGAIPWWGRIYVPSVTLVLASIAAYAFCSLGRAEAKTYYGIPRKA